MGARSSSARVAASAESDANAQGLLERDDELAVLSASVERLIESGDSDVVLVEGPPGIGKSRLLRAATELAAEAGVPVISAHGTELEFELAFGAVRQLFAGPLLALDQLGRERVLQGPAGLARPVLGLRVTPTPANPGDPLYGLFWLTANLIRGQPLVLALDDLHWFDSESARFVAYLARRVSDIPLVVIATSRLHEPGAGDEAAQTLAEVGTVLRPRLLSEQAVGDLVPGAPAGEAYRATGGNPYLVAELTRSRKAHDPLPAGSVDGSRIARQVLERTSRISPDATALSRAISLFPDGASLEEAATVADLDDSRATTAADALARAEVIRATDRLRFLHPLMRAAVYEDTGPFARRVGHATAAEALKRSGAPNEQVAAHLLAGKPVGDPENVRILRAVAADALEAAAPHAAERYLERALAEPPQPGDRAELLHRWGQAGAMAGSPHAESALREALDAASTPGERVEVAIDLALCSYANMHYDDAVGVLESVRLLPGVGDEQRLMVDALTMSCAFDGTDAHAYHEAALRLPADLPGDTPAERFALVQVAWHQYGQGGSIDSVRQLADRAFRDTGPQVFPVGTDIGDSLILLIVCDRHAEARAMAEKRRDQARKDGAVARFASAQVVLGQIAFELGELRLAEETLRLGLEAPTTQSTDLLSLAKWLATGLVAQGRLDEAEEVLDGVSGRAGTFASSQADLRRALIALARGQFELALPTFESMHRQCLDRGVTSARDHIWFRHLATALAGVGRRDEAIELMTDLHRRGVQYGSAYPIGVALLTLGRLHGGSAARDYFEQAHEVLAPSLFRSEAALAQVELGAALRRDNQRAAARDLLREALDYAVRNDVRPLAAQAQAELALTGARPRRLLVTGAGSLTPSESRIAGLAAEGMSNHEIAQHLFLTVKTVETHLAASYRKLQISSRRDLKAALAT